MAHSTKWLMAESLKKLLNTKPLDKITVKELVEDCGVNRQTFYYNFKDIYDLLEWAFEEDARHLLEEKQSYDNWQEVFWAAFHYLLDNKVLVLNTFNSVGRSYLENRLKARLMPVVRNMLEQKAGSLEMSDLDACLMRFNLPKTFSADYSLDGKKWVQVAQRISRSEEAMCRWEVVSNDPEECARYNGYVKEITDKYVKAGWAHY